LNFFHHGLDDKLFHRCPARGRQCLTFLVEGVRKINDSPHRVSPVNMILPRKTVFYLMRFPFASYHVRYCTIRKGREVCPTKCRDFPIRSGSHASLSNRTEW